MVAEDSQETEEPDSDDAGRAEPENGRKYLKFDMPGIIVAAISFLIIPVWLYLAFLIINGAIK
jgi:hypothetical protein